MQEYGKKGVNVDNLVHAQMAKAKRSGRTLTYAEAFEEVVADSNEIMGDINQAAQALKAQAESFKQIAAGVTHINDVVQMNSATSEECAAASQEMNSQAEMLEALMQNFRVVEM